MARQVAFGGSDDKFGDWLRGEPGAKECASYAELCSRYGFTEGEAASDWMAARFDTFKAHPDSYLWRPLMFPAARKAAELFDSVALFPTMGDDVGKRGLAFLSLRPVTRGEPGARLGGSFGGVRGRRPDGVNTRYGAVHFGPYVKARAGLSEMAETTYGPRGLDVGYAYQAIARADGVLVTLSASQIIGSHYLALLDPGENFRDLLSAADLARQIESDELEAAPLWRVTSLCRPVHAIGIFEPRDFLIYARNETEAREAAIMEAMRLKFETLHTVRATLEA